MDATTLQSAVMDCSASHATLYAPYMTEAMSKYGITTPARQAMFLAQVGHESGALQWTEEFWGPTAAQSRYQGRVDLGNTQPGDGYNFRGRGLIQLTGRTNYAAASTALGVDFIGHPDLLASPYYAALSAGWFWAAHGLNELADADEFTNITRRINGGLNGQSDRLARWAVAKQALSA